MLNLNISNLGFTFSVNIDGQDIPFEDWCKTDDCIYYLPLATMVDNGYASYLGAKCNVPFENIYYLDDDDKFLLGVPDNYDKSIRIRGEGLLNSNDFKYKLELLSHVPDGELLTYKRIENIIIIEDKKFLLNENQYELIKRIETFNSVEEKEKSTDNNLRHFATIKELAIKSNCQLDSYLQNENVFIPEKIKIEVGKDEIGYSIEPSVDIEENENFKNSFHKMRKVQGVYPLQRENGERVRVVLSPEQKNNLNYLRETGGKYRTAEEIKEIVSHPTEYFDPDSFDLSELYSDRVIEIGVYKPKFYPFISPYKSCWIVGATIETPENGTAKITIENEEELSSLEEVIETAENNNEQTIEFKDCVLDINDAKFLAETAKKQLKQPKKPLDSTSLNNRKVLIIEENAENLGFSATEDIIESGNKYTLYKNPYLQDDFNLKAHQEEGVSWLQYLYINNASGCLMADDMGLGKTLQILYFIDWHSRKYTNHKPYLIVAPVSLLENWENEYNKFFKSPRMKINRLTSRDIPRHFNKSIVEMMQGMDIILTNYESLRISQLNFCAVEFDVIALDEAQKIKSPGTLITNAAKALKSNFKIALTGTPVENTLLDLWCIMDYCVPGLLGNAKSFAAKYQKPLKQEDVDLDSLGNEIHEKLGLYFIRRLKKDAAKDLPNKFEIKQEVQMPSIQECTYVDVMNQYISGNQPNMLITIMDMREVSEHPYIYDSTLANHGSAELVNSSARLQATISFLDKIKSRNEKVIIFAERKETQKMLQRICLDKYGVVSKIINGDTPTISMKNSNNNISRQAAIDNFQSQPGFNIIIMSPVAAGMGLNVTAANHVIHYSRHWNPAKENQATDRAYRIGQTKDVFVYYPMATSSKFKSFDQTLDELLNRKTSLASSTIFPTERIEVKQEELGHILFNK